MAFTPDGKVSAVIHDWVFEIVSAPPGCTATVAKPKPLEANDKQKLSESFFTNLPPRTNFGFKMASAPIVACP
jgi:hypothetical protein